MVGQLTKLKLHPCYVYVFFQIIKIVHFFPSDRAMSVGLLRSQFLYKLQQQVCYKAFVICWLLSIS